MTSEKPENTMAVFDGWKGEKIVIWGACHAHGYFSFLDTKIRPKRGQKERTGSGARNAQRPL